MALDLSRRQFGKLMAGTGASAAFLQLGRTAAIAAPVAGYKAMVGIFLFGGNDGWNMVVPNDARFAGYAASRGTVALTQSSLVPLAGSAYGLNAALQPLQQIWNEGSLNLVLNAGTLYQPLTKAQYQSSPLLRPVNLMSHADEQAHWQGLRARDINVDGFLGRLNDRAAATTLPGLISFNGTQLAVLGKTSSPLVLPSTGTVVQNAATGNSADPAVFARNSAISAFADGSSYGTVTKTTGAGISSAYAQASTANTILASTSSTVDQYFVRPGTTTALTSDISRQLLRVARMIEARSTLGQARQTFFTAQGGYDTHANEAPTQTALYTDLAQAMLAFYNAMKALGLNENVTAFTMSDFGRVYKGNAQNGTDHAWGNNHLVMGGALKSKMVYGTYPSTTLGSSDDITGDGRFLPTISQEQYLGPIAAWQGVASADMPYVFPNWATFSGNTLGLFQG
ncbi:uncharacterized protein (DUF1501 family) [Sphingomonas vulcanisoli]|uniref:Uncharacterized protein (DUF1501 family) n=1 Tax=Sphingomonas vulcanisoli TaxID=1658060 RepID=A0ABX0TQD8_9SPHN|nr:DUF1501 domain-containing protein [Sphingomonas vulcanisoli]NIJ07747.1 uncharacterized protein (DUF1501 family) [Sphingomonas vulcanisoli]